MSGDTPGIVAVMTNPSPPRIAGHRVGLSILAVGIAAIGISVSGAAAAGTQQATQAKCSRANPGFVVGDSVVDAINYLRPKPISAIVGGGKVDGDVNRQFDEGAAVITSYLAASPRACAVVVALGTNGPVRPSQWASLMSKLKSVPRVVVINTYTKDFRRGQPWMNQVNAQIAALPAKYRNVRVADWASMAPSLSSTELPDGVHPDTPRAADKFTSTVTAALRAR